MAGVKGTGTATRGAVDEAGAASPARRGHALGESTRERIVVAAERLFAEQGIDRVSLRQIGLAAGQRNTAAVKYHFGDKDGLLRAIFDLRLAEIAPARERLLEQAQGSGRLRDPHTLVEAFARPLADSTAGSVNYVALLAQVQLRDGGPHPYNLADPALRSTASRVFELMQRVVPLPDVGDRARRVALVSGFIVTALAARRAVLAGGPGRGRGYLGEVVDLGAAMLIAPRHRTTRTEWPPT